jgi:hypothetical protein
MEYCDEHHREADKMYAHSFDMTMEEDIDPHCFVL